jgi:hypothetical protein
MLLVEIEYDEPTPIGATERARSVGELHVLLAERLPRAACWIAVAVGRFVRLKLALACAPGGIAILARTREQAARHQWSWRRVVDILSCRQARGRVAIATRLDDGSQHVAYRGCAEHARFRSSSANTRADSERADPAPSALESSGIDFGIDGRTRAAILRARSIRGGSDARKCRDVDSASVDLALAIVPVHQPHPHRE